MSNEAAQRESEAGDLEALQEASQRLFMAEDEEEVAEIIVEIADTILNADYIAVWSYDDQAGELDPLLSANPGSSEINSEGFDTDLRSISDGTKEMEVFKKGVTALIEDYQNVDAPAHPESHLRTLLITPLGQVGQLHLGSDELTSVNSEEQNLVEIIAKSAERALNNLAKQRELERSRRLLARTEKLASVGGWEVDLHSNSLNWTDGTRRIHGVDDDYEPTIENALEFYHPEDQGRLRDAFKRCQKFGEPYQIEARIVTDDGRERWVETTGKRSGSDRDANRLHGAIRDITGRKEREQQLSVLYRILRHNLRNSHNIILGNLNAIEQELTQWSIPSHIEGRELEAFQKVVDKLPEITNDLGNDIEALELTLETLTDLPIEDLQSNIGRVEAECNNLLSMGDKANRLRSLLAGVEGELERCNLESTVEKVIEDLHQTYPSTSIETNDLDPHAVRASSGKLALALRELLENAIEHAGAESRAIHVRSQLEGTDSIVIQVVDDGPGIPHDELDALHQGDEEELIHSSGFGLWMVNWLANHLNGTLKFETNNQDGTVVSLTLLRPSDLPDSRGDFYDS